MLSSGSENRNSAVKAYLEEKLKKSSRIGLENWPEVSIKAMTRNLREQEVSGAVLPIHRRRKGSVLEVNNGETGPSEGDVYQISTPVKSMLLITVNGSQVCWRCLKIFISTIEKRIEFENGEEETPLEKRTLADDVSRSGGCSVAETGILALSDIESLSRVLAGQAIIHSWWRDIGCSLRVAS